MTSSPIGRDDEVKVNGSDSIKKTHRPAAVGPVEAPEVAVRASESDVAEPRRWVALQREIQAPLHEMLLRLHRGPDGFIRFLSKRADRGGNLAPVRSIKVGALEATLPESAEQLSVNAYFSLNSPYRAMTHTTKDLRYLNVVYADLDFGHEDEEKGRLTVSEALDLVDTAQFQGVIPPASIIVKSGRGLWLFWLLVDPETDLPPRAYPRSTVPLCKAIQVAINRRLDAFDERLKADTNALDVSRLSRIPGSQHSGAKKEKWIGRRDEAGKTVFEKVDGGMAVVTWLVQTDVLGRGFLYTLGELARLCGVGSGPVEVASAPAVPRSAPQENLPVRRVEEPEVPPARKAAAPPVPGKKASEGLGSASAPKPRAVTPGPVKAGPSPPRGLTALQEAIATYLAKERPARTATKKVPGRAAGWKQRWMNEIFFVHALQRVRGGISKGLRHSAASYLGLFLRRLGASDDDVRRQLRAFATGFKQPFSDGDVEAAVKASASLARGGKIHLKHETLVSHLRVTPAEDEKIRAMALPPPPPPPKPKPPRERARRERQAALREVFASELSATGKVPSCRSLARKLKEMGIKASKTTIDADLKALRLSTS